MAATVGLVVTAAVAVQKTIEVAGPYVKPIIEKSSAVIDKKITELKERVELPEIPSSNSRIMLDEAKKMDKRQKITCGGFGFKS